MKLLNPPTGKDKKMENEFLVKPKLKHTSGANYLTGHCFPAFQSAGAIRVQAEQ